MRAIDGASHAASTSHTPYMHSHNHAYTNINNIFLDTIDADMTQLKKILQTHNTIAITI